MLTLCLLLAAPCFLMAAYAHHRLWQVGRVLASILELTGMRLATEAMEAENDVMEANLARLKAERDRLRAELEELQAGRDLEEYDHGNDLPLLRRFDDQDEP